MGPYEHHRQRLLHRYRHGWAHYAQHRDGERHAHRRRSSSNSPSKPPVSPREAYHHSRRFLRGRWPGEIGLQIALGTALAILVAFVICAVWGGVTLWQARSDLRGAQSEATSIAQDRTQLFTSHGRRVAQRRVAAMQKGADHAARIVGSSIPLHALSWIPLVGQQVTGVTQLVSDFDVTSHQAGSLLDSVNQLVNYSHGTTVSLPALDILKARVATATVALRPLNRGSGLLIGPIASARDSFDAEIVRVTGLLTAGGHLLDYAGPFLGTQGPRTYLVAGENNSEMRDQGAVLSWAIMTARNGTFEMTSPQSVGTLRLARPAPYVLPPGTASAFGALQPTRVWQSVNATGGFPMSGQVMAQMYHQRTGRHVDGVVAVDAAALKNVLRVTGGVRVENIPLRVTAKNVEYVLLHGLYLLYPKGYEQGARHDEIAAVATAAVDHMKHHRYDLAFLVDQLSKATRGRHLLVWSRFPALQNAVTRFGGSGSLVALGGNSVHLSIQSAVAAKLDWYLRTSANYEVTVDQNGTATIAAKIVVANTAPRRGKPHYVFGPDHVNSFYRGQYVGRMDLWFPRGSITPGGLPESGLALSRAVINVLPQHSQTFLLSAVVPNAVKGNQLTLHFIPQSTLNPQQIAVSFQANGWSWAGPQATSWTARTTKTLTWQLNR